MRKSFMLVPYTLDLYWYIYPTGWENQKGPETPEVLFPESQNFVSDFSKDPVKWRLWPFHGSFGPVQLVGRLVDQIGGVKCPLLRF